KLGKFLPLPIFITEPAIGEGLGAALVYFHKEKKDDGLNATTGRALGKTGKRSKPPPTATGIFGAYTNDDTAIVGIGHSNSFMDDRYRVLGATAETRINSQLYLADKPFNFTFEGNLLFANLKTRIGDSSAFFGITTSYVDANIDYDTRQTEFENTSFVDVGLAVSMIYDTRDNTLMPTSGYIVDLSTWRYDETFGGDFDYQKHILEGSAYFDFAENYVLGLRLDLSSSDGDVPFYAEPYVKLRGIPALRYQGETAGAVEVELRRRLGERWLVS
ncbi:MAG: BamA/TamA family outer membrane protein, partial [Gammaproteobacteria bacterium]|nr:BamA/TamA family outer membrane protein [Gammaproteobacteria bacterium]